ncbi:MAG TPA: FKBP-type peptidyl-prolyl cis-trans isomerase [Cellvibrio sp.]|nr:FKBP-type peptidyl-prolyl cis-trans isomerase [Cellvibrio sp.]
MISKKLVMISLMASAALVVGCGKDAKKEEAPKLETLDQKISYLMGQQMGKGVQQMEITLDKDLLLLAIADVKAATEAQVKIAELEKKDQATLTKEETAELEKLRAVVKPRISEEDQAKVSTEFQAAMQKKQEEKQKKLSETNGAEGTKFLADNKAKEGVQVTASGLQYKVITAGNGVKPKATDTVKVHYTGKLVNGTVFDTSAGKDPVEFPVNQVIPGWVEAMQLMPQGSKWELYIPSDLAYGPAGNQGIPPASTLIFEVELLEVKAAAVEAAPAKPAKK